MAALVEYKVVLVGKIGVGKSSISLSFINNHFVDGSSVHFEKFSIKPFNICFSIGYNPAIEDSFRKQLIVDGQPCIIEFLDTADFSEWTNLYLHQAQGLILIYAINSAESFAAILSFM